MSQAAKRHRRSASTSYLLRLTPQQSDELKQLAEQRSLTVRALLLHSTLGTPLDDPGLDATPGRKLTRHQEMLPMTG